MFPAAAAVLGAKDGKSWESSCQIEEIMVEYYPINSRAGQSSGVLLSFPLGQALNMEVGSVEKGSP